MRARDRRGHGWHPCPSASRPAGSRPGAPGAARGARPYHIMGWAAHVCVRIVGALIAQVPEDRRAPGQLPGGPPPGQTRELLEWHIEGCAPCVAFVNTYRGTINAARKLRDVEIPPELKNRLLAVLRSQRASHEPRA